MESNICSAANLQNNVIEEASLDVSRDCLNSSIVIVQIFIIVVTTCNLIFFL